MFFFIKPGKIEINAFKRLNITFLKDKKVQEALSDLLKYKIHKYSATLFSTIAYIFRLPILAEKYMFYLERCFPTVT